MQLFRLRIINVETTHWPYYTIYTLIVHDSNFHQGKYSIQDYSNCDDLLSL